MPHILFCISLCQALGAKVVLVSYRRKQKSLKHRSYIQTQVGGVRGIQTCQHPNLYYFPVIWTVLEEFGAPLNPSHFLSVLQVSLRSYFSYILAVLLIFVLLSATVSSKPSMIFHFPLHFKL